MSATIIYSIDSGKAPFRVWLWGTSYPMQIRYSTGTYTFDNVECGEYKIVIIDAEDCIYEIPFTYPCPATTTTTEEPIITTTTTEIVTTTTTEALEEYPCNYPINYYGYEYEEIIQINLGAATGAVLFDFNLFYIPVKVIVEFDGTEVINTGYRGNVVNQALLDAALIALDEPTETINPVSQGILEFVKATATEFAIVKIYTPLAGSIASIKLRCPVTLVESWSAAFSDHVCIEEVPTTTTTTEEVIVTTTTTDDGLLAAPTVRNWGEVWMSSAGLPACDPLTYPRDYPIPKPNTMDNAVIGFTWEDIEYVEVVDVYPVPGLVLRFGGVVVSAGMKFYPVSSISFDESLLATAEWNCEQLTETWVVRYKVAGRRISESKTYTIGWNNTMCPDCIATTTTTTTP